MTTLCPMCRKHNIITNKIMEKTIIHGETICYPAEISYCSTLGKEHKDAYFYTAKQTDNNLLSAQNTYLQNHKHTIAKTLKEAYRLSHQVTDSNT